MLTGGKTSPDTYLLWGTQAAYILMIALSTWFWGNAINQVGQFSPSLGFLLKLGMNPYFLLAMFVGLASTVVTYYARYSIGVAKGSLFYSLGTIALVITSYVTLGERFTMQQGVGVILIMAGVVLVS